jgi:hypothetical protein
MVSYFVAARRYDIALVMLLPHVYMLFSPPQLMLIFPSLAVAPRQCPAATLRVVSVHLILLNPLM